MACSTGLAFTLGHSCGWNRWAERPASYLGGLVAKFARAIGVETVGVRALPAVLTVPIADLDIRGGTGGSVRAMHIRRRRSDLELPEIELRLEKSGKG
jgi:hypothetical protein